MYKVYNLTKHTESECDAIETITVINGEYHPIEREGSDGFKAMKIVEVSPSEQYYDITIFRFEGHTLIGGEDEGRYEDEPEEEILPDEENNN